MEIVIIKKIGTTYVIEAMEDHELLFSSPSCVLICDMMQIKGYRPSIRSKIEYEWLNYC